MPRRHLTPAAGALVCVLAAVAAGPALADSTPDEVAAKLSVERAANGLPAGIVADRELSRGCELHNDYERRNGTYDHSQDPARPAYTEEGAKAAQESNLARGTSWSLGNPFALAPLHLMDLLDPRLTRIGVSDVDGYVCVRTGDAPRAQGLANVLHTVPGDQRADVAPSETAREHPFVPGDHLGLPEGTTTGPHLYLLPDGPAFPAGFNRVTVARVTLTGPEGPVEVRHVDGSTPEVAQYLPPGGIAVAVHPLREGALYTASAEVVSPYGDRVSRTWQFRTAGASERAEIRAAVVRGSEILVNAATAGLAPTLSIESGGPIRQVAMTRTGDGWSASLRAPGPGEHLVCVRAGRRADGAAAAEDCEPVRVGGDRRVALGLAVSPGRGIVLTAPAALRGARAVVTARVCRRACSGPVTRRTLRLKGATRVAVPGAWVRRRDRVDLTIRVRPKVRDGVRYSTPVLRRTVRLG